MLAYPAPDMTARISSIALPTPAIAAGIAAATFAACASWHGPVRVA